MFRVSLLCLALAAAAPAGAQVLTFDDLPATTWYANLPDGYGGFDWDNGAQLGYINRNLSPGSGYDHGTVSGDYTAFNLWAKTPASVDLVGPGRIYYVGAYFSSAWQDVDISFEGWNDGVQLYTSPVYTLHTTGPQWIELDWYGIDSLKILSTPGKFTHWAMDNFTTRNVAAPETAWLLGLALLGMAGAGRRRLLSA